MHLAGRGLLSSNKTRGTEKDILNVLDLVIHLTRGTEKCFLWRDRIVLFDAENLKRDNGVIHCKLEMNTSPALAAAALAPISSVFYWGRLLFPAEKPG